MFSFLAKRTTHRSSSSTTCSKSVDPAFCVYAIGDLHGRVDLLESLMKTIVADQEQLKSDRKMVMVFLGDYIDRGDQSRNTIRFLIDLADAAGDNAKFLMGNHEAAMLDFLNGTSDGKTWLSFGGLQTVASYGVPMPGANPTEADLSRLRADLISVMGEHREFLQSLRPFWQSGDYFFSHAGVDPARSLTEQSAEVLYFGNDQFIEGKPHPDARIVHGHYDSAKPVVEPHRICVDTGAYYSGRLTAVRLDDNVTFLNT